MAMFEVSYTEGEEVKSELIEATTPSEAARLFMQKYPDGSKMMLCVLRQ